MKLLTFLAVAAGSTTRASAVTADGVSPMASLLLSSFALLPTAAEASSVASSVPFRPLETNSSLFVLNDADSDPASAWSAYEQFLLDSQRSVPFTLLFTEGDEDCEDIDDDDDGGEWGDAVLSGDEERQLRLEQHRRACLDRATYHELVMTAMKVVGEKRSSADDPIVVVGRDQLPKAFDYVRCSSASLDRLVELWQA